MENDKERIFFRKKTLIPIAVLFLLIPGVVYSTHDHPRDYSRLVELIRLEHKKSPIYIFNNFEENVDKESLKANLAYFKENPGLVRKIQTDLGGAAIEWKLDNLEQRLLFVPEEREDFATLFESYCHDVIDYVLDKTNLNNPFSSIQTLDREKPAISNNSSNGITAYLVHNLAKEFISTFIFSNQKQKKLKIELNGTIFSGEVGSYSSYIYLKDNGIFDFTRANYTVWQNSAENPYTALMTPVEETLHIVLRKYTEGAIKQTIEKDSVKSLKEVQEIAEDWISVEEAIVGGLVHELLPVFAKKHISNLSDSLIDSDIKLKSKIKKYRHLKKGITLVKQVGYQESIKMYKADPAQFRNLLTL